MRNSHANSYLTLRNKHGAGNDVETVAGKLMPEGGGLLVKVYFSLIYKICMYAVTDMQLLANAVK